MSSARSGWLCPGDEEVLPGAVQRPCPALTNHSPVLLEDSAGASLVQSDGRDRDLVRHWHDPVWFALQPSVRCLLLPFGEGTSPQDDTADQRLRAQPGECYL